jgi:hypothetical protein
MGGEWSLNEALSQALTTESVKAEARPSARLREVMTGAAMGTLQVTKHGRTG